MLNSLSLKESAVKLQLGGPRVRRHSHPVTDERLGAHVKRLREVRRLTQEQLAARSDLASDTISRLEHEEFSPSLRTLRKVCKGLGISVAAMFNALELSEPSEHMLRITTLLVGRSVADLQVSERVLTELLDGLDEHRGAGPGTQAQP